MNELPITLGIRVSNHDAWRWNIELLIANLTESEITQVSLEVWPESISPSFLVLESIGSKALPNKALCGKVPKSDALPTTVRVTCKTVDGSHQEFSTRISNSLLNEVVPSGDSWRTILESHGIGHIPEQKLESYRHLPLTEVPTNEFAIVADDHVSPPSIGVGASAADVLVDDDDLVLSCLGSDSSVAGDSGIGSGLGSSLGDVLADDELVIADDDDDLVISGAGSDISVAGDSGINLMSPSDSGLSLESEPLDLAGSSISALDLGQEISEGGSSGAGSGSMVDFQADEEFQLSPSGISLEPDFESGLQVFEVEESEAIEFAAADLAEAGDMFGAEAEAVEVLGMDVGEEGISVDEAAAVSAIGGASGGGEFGKGVHESNAGGLDKRPTKSQKADHQQDCNETKEHPRWSDVSFPHSTVMNEWAELTIAIILKEQLLPDGRKVPVAKPRMTDQELILKASSNEQVHVDVVVSAPGYKIKGEPFATIEVPLDRDSEKATFLLAGLEEGPKPVLINFYQNKRYIGTVSLESCVVRNAGHGVQDTAKNKVDVDFSGSGSAPDLTLNITENTLPTGQTELRFTLISTLDEIHLQDGGSVLLRQEPSSWLEQAFSSVEQLNRAEEDVEWTLRRLQSIGHELYEQLFPVRLKEVFQSCRDRINSIMVVSDEPWIPWEMVKPSETLRPQESKHLCEEYRFSRWLSGTPISPTLNAQLAKIVPVQEAIVSQSYRDINVVPNHGSASPAKQTFDCLPNVEAEVDMFRELESHGTEVGVIDSKLRSVMQVIDQGDYDILHFACHGSYNEQSPDLSVLQLRDGCMTAVDLNSSKPASKRRRPMVFLNACHSGRGGFGLTRLGNWASAFSKLNCGAFIGSLWPVEDEAAYRFAKHFYTQLFEGMPIGDAFREARISIKEAGNSTWLAFCLYADPNALLSIPEREPEDVRENPRPSIEDTTPSQKSFDLALQKRNIVVAASYLADFSGTEFHQTAHSRWDWAARHELCRLSSVTNSYLKAKQLRMAERRVHDICQILSVDMNLASQVSSFLDETVRLVIALVPRGFPITHINEMYRSFIQSFYLKPKMKNVLTSDIRKLSLIIREIDELDIPAAEGFFAKRRYHSSINRAIRRVAAEHNVVEHWLRKAIMANVARWPNVVHALHPDFFTKHHARILIENGLLRLDAGKTVEAIDQFQQAIKAEPELATAYNNIAWAYVVSDERDPQKLKYALGQVEKALTLKERPAFLDTLAELERRLGNFHDALQALERALEIEKTEPIIWADKIDLLRVEMQESLDSEILG